jgi:hypothetical protein
MLLNQKKRIKRQKTELDLAMSKKVLYKDVKIEYDATRELDSAMLNYMALF